MCGDFSAANGRRVTSFELCPLWQRLICAMYGYRFCSEYGGEYSTPPYIRPSIQNLPLWNYSAKHGTSQAHRLAELLSTAQLYAQLLDMIISTDVALALLVSQINL